jgi:hypothetical protein
MPNWPLSLWKSGEFGLMHMYIPMTIVVTLILVVGIAESISKGLSSTAIPSSRDQTTKNLRSERNQIKYSQYVRFPLPERLTRLKYHI